MYVKHLPTLLISCAPLVDQGSRGLTGVKRSSTLKMLLLTHITSYSHVSHVCEVSTHSVYKVCSISRSEVIWGHRGQKIKNHQNCYRLSMLQVMIIILMHMSQLKTIYQCYGVKCQSGVIWRHKCQKVKFTKIATSTYYVLWSCSNSCMWSVYSPYIPSVLLDQGSNGETGVKRSKLPNML